MPAIKKLPALLLTVFLFSACRANVSPLIIEESPLPTGERIIFASDRERG